MTKHRLAHFSWEVSLSPSSKTAFEPLQKSNPRNEKSSIAPYLRGLPFTVAMDVGSQRISQNGLLTIAS